MAQIGDVTFGLQLEIDLPCLLLNFNLAILLEELRFDRQLGCLPNIERNVQIRRQAKVQPGELPFAQTLRRLIDTFRTAQPFNDGVYATVLF